MHYAGPSDSLDPVRRSLSLAGSASQPLGRGPAEVSRSWKQKGRPSRPLPFPQKKPLPARRPACRRRTRRRIGRILRQGPRRGFGPAGRRARRRCPRRVLARAVRRARAAPEHIPGQSNPEKNQASDQDHQDRAAARALTSPVVVNGIAHDCFRWAFTPGQGKRGRRGRGSAGWVAAARRPLRLARSVATSGFALRGFDDFSADGPQTAVTGRLQIRLILYGDVRIAQHRCRRSSVVVVLHSLGSALTCEHD